MPAKKKSLRIVTIGPLVILWFLAITFFIGKGRARRSLANNSTGSTKKNELSKQETARTIDMLRKKSTSIDIKKSRSIGCIASTPLKGERCLESPIDSAIPTEDRFSEGGESRYASLRRSESIVGDRLPSDRRALRVDPIPKTNIEQVGMAVTVAVAVIVRWSILQKAEGPSDVHLLYGCSSLNST